MRRWTAGLLLCSGCAAGVPDLEGTWSRTVSAPVGFDENGEPDAFCGDLIHSFKFDPDGAYTEIEATTPDPDDDDCPANAEALTITSTGTWTRVERTEDGEYVLAFSVLRVVYDHEKDADDFSEDLAVHWWTTIGWSVQPEDEYLWLYDLGLFQRVGGP